MTFQGFIHIHREFLVDGKTLVVLGVRDLDARRLLRTHVRVLDAPEAGDFFQAFEEAMADAPVESVEVPMDIADAAPATFAFPVAGLDRAGPRKAVVLAA